MSGSAEVAVSRLLEREAELARVDRVFDRVGAGAGAVVVVEGPAGIGKSELLAAVGAGAQARGLDVLRARGSEFEAEIAFGIARQLFEPTLRTASPGERHRLLDGVARVGARALGVEEGEAPADRFAAIHGLYWLCANRAERGPLVVSVDDVQWIDDPSLAWLGYLARRVGDLPLLLVVGLRSGDRDGERGELKQLMGDDGVQRIVLGPLSAAAVGAIVRAQFDEDADERFCSACWELSGGNPLFVRELLAAAGGEELSARGESVAALRRIAPGAVGPSVLARLARMGADAVALARAVAVLGAGAEVVLAAQLAQLDPVAAELIADRLAAGQIFAPARPFEFLHPVIGAAVLEDIAPGARRVAHRRAAALLDDGRGEGALARVASHLLACGPAGDGWVVGRLGEAAREALDRAAPEVAVDYLRRALSEPPAASERSALLLLLGTAEWRAGQPDAVAHLENAIAATDDDLGTLLAASTLLARAYYGGDRTDRAVEVLDRALVAVSDTSAGISVALEAAATAIGLMDERTAPRALRRAERLRGRLGELADPPLNLLVLLAHHAARGNRAADARELAQRVLVCEPYPPPAEILPLLIGTLAYIECYEQLERLCEAMLADARRRGSMHDLVAISVLRARASCDRGALADAEADARWALELGEGIFRIHAIYQLIRVLVERDELEEAENVLGQYPDPCASHYADGARYLSARGQLRHAQGRLQDALADFLGCGQRCVALGISTMSAASWRADAALVHAALGNTEQARRLADEQLGLARAFALPRTLGVSLRACGMVEGGETGLELLGEAVETLGRSQSPLELARALADYGGALRRAGRRVEARAELERALDLAHRLGARRIANQARGELIAAGARPRRDAITGRDALTAAELRVARLAAEGLGNREIAQALFIATKTAKAHLGRVYRKLEITRRGQLADALSGVLDDGDEGREGPAATSTILS